MKSFMKNEFYNLAIAGAFQRAKIYQDGISDGQKKQFRNHFKSVVFNLSDTYLHITSEEQHIKNILALQENSREFVNILRNGQLNIGISQKLLNLFLKYIWCVGWIAEPPHCPIDRNVICILNLESPINWTSITDIDDYCWIISSIKDRLTGGMSIARWELDIFNNARNNN